MLLLAVDDGDLGALLMIRAVMSNPSLAEDLMTEARFVVGTFMVVGILGIRVCSIHFESMRRGAQTNHRSATSQVCIEVLHLLRWEILKAQKHHGQIGRLERFEARHVGIARDDFTRRLVDVEQHGAFETVMLGQNARELRQCFFGAILVITREEDNMLSLARSVGPFVNERCGTRPTREADNSTEQGG